MNMQSMMQQVQGLQKKMLTEQEEINKKEFVGKSSFVSVKMSGKKEVLEVKIDTEEIQKDEIDLLEDMIKVAVNDCLKQIDKETETRLGKYTKGIPGLF